MKLILAITYILEPLRRLLRHALPRMVSDQLIADDLEDVLDHVFAQGFLEARFRTMTWWETLDGTLLPASREVHDILSSGAGHCPEHAVKLVIGKFLFRPLHEAEGGWFW